MHNLMKVLQDISEQDWPTLVILSHGYATTAEDQIPDPSKEVSRISRVRPPLLLVIVFLLQEMLHSMDSVLPPPVLSSPPGR